jgi:acyl-CoA dehydrogenase
MILLNPKKFKVDYNDEKTRDLLQKLINWFEKKGLRRIKDDDLTRIWYSDFLEFVKENKLFSTFLTPKQYGDEGCRWDSRRNCEFNEILGF